MEITGPSFTFSLQQPYTGLILLNQVESLKLNGIGTEAIQHSPLKSYKGTYLLA